MKEEIKIMYKDILKPVGKGAVKLAYCVATSGFIIPTTVYKIKEEEAKPKPNLDYSSLLMTSSLIPLFALVPKVLSFFGPGKISLDFKYLTPLCEAYALTNITSGAYEMWRYTKNKSKKSSASAALPLPAGLETKVSQPKINPSVPKGKIPNPWDYEIDEIKNVAYEMGER